MNDANQAYSELVGLFHNPEDLERAISTLTSSGWDRAELSLLAQHHIFQPDEVEDPARNLAGDPDADRQAPVSENDVRQGRTLATGMASVVAAFAASGATIMTGGTALAAVIGAAVAGGGAGAIVEALGRHAGSQRDQFLHEQMEQGGILLWVRLDEPEQEGKARDILQRCGATHIQMHERD